MNFLSKIFFILISIALFSFLLFVTYVTGTFSTFQKPYYEKTDLWLFELIKDENNNFSIKKNINVQTWALLVENINLSDKVIFSEGSVEVEKNITNTIISISKWIYIFDLSEVNINYIIKWEWFEITNKWPWIFIINNINSKENLIFPISSKLDLTLINTRSNNELTTLDLYPHMYLIFNLRLNSLDVFLKNADLLILKDKNKLWYFSNKILNNKIISEKFLDLASLRKSENQEMLTNGLLFLEQEYSNNLSIINTFLESSFWFMPGESFITQYSDIFINPNKKSSYYKNIIIRNLHKLLSISDIDSDIINNIAANYKLLEEIDKAWAEEINNIIWYYYKAAIKSSKDINTQVNLLELTNRINNNKIDYKLKSLIYLEKTFFNYDFLDENDFYSNVAVFRRQYFEDLNVSTELSDDNKLYIDDLENTDYLLFFLENLLLSDYLHIDIETKDLLIIFNDYVKIANSFYNYNDEKTKRTWLFTNSQILNKFVNILESKYFLIDRNKDWLLEINEETLIIKNDILLLEKDINEIIEFYKDYKLILKPSQNNKDKFISELYEILELKYNEYFTALKNYEEYLVIYNKSKTNLLSTNTINENNNVLVLSENHALEYLSNFNGLQLNNINISIMDYSYCSYPSPENEKAALEVPYCYKIDNLKIDTNNISFLLHPFEKNKIDEIYINDDPSLWSHKLDEVEEVLEEKKKTETKDKDKYEFKNFLIDTLWDQTNNENNDENNNQEDNQIQEEEETVVKVFKRNKLLWETWDFINLEWFIDIAYNDLIVKKLENDDEYSIYINKATLNLDLWRNKSYYWIFRSDYIFSPSHSFLNPEIKLIDQKSKKDLLLWNYIYIDGTYKVNNIEEELKTLFNSYDNINYVVSNISQILWENNIKITYSKDLTHTIFEVEHKWESIYIKLLDWNFTEFKYNNIEQISKPAVYTKINLILNNIKKKIWQKEISE